LTEKMYNINFVREKISANFGKTTLLEAANKLQIFINSPCGGNKICGRCKVRITKGNYPPTTLDLEYLTPEEVQDGIRTACSHIINCDTEIETLQTPKENAAQILASGIKRDVEINPGIYKTNLTLTGPTIENATSDSEQIVNALENPSLKMGPALLANLPIDLRKNKYNINVTYTDSEILNIGPVSQSSIYGIAVDLGTTTVVCKLIDLQSGNVLATSSQINSQKAYGEDVISRISYSKENDGLNTLQTFIINQLNTQFENLFISGNINRSDVMKVTLVGNTVMQHIFLGIPPFYLAELPFIPVFRNSQNRSAKDLKLNVNPNAIVKTFPIIGGYLGGDTSAVVLTLAEDLKGPWLAVDIGTNGEMVLSKDGELFGCSTAAGPAFEGAHIRCGMRAVDGAISSIETINNSPKLSVIGNKGPTGICGSGLIDALNFLLLSGHVSEMGRLESPKTRDNNVDEENYSFAPNVYVGQKDIRELQLAKGAFATGIQILLKNAGIQKNDLKAIYLAGAFGQFINKASAVNIGLLPKIPLDRIHFIGNAACSGAELALVSKEQESLASTLALKTRHIEISTDPDFNDLFMDSMLFDCQALLKKPIKSK
jgi:uncharacterized 2Fe-2S/4Fe-4S cluster protein (DUF4445 family)